MRPFIFLLVVGPLLALMFGYTSTSPDPAKHAPLVPKYTPAISDELVTPEPLIDHSQVVVTIMSFPFDVGGNTPYDVRIADTQYVFDPEDVTEFIKKGRKQPRTRERTRLVTNRQTPPGIPEPFPGDQL